MVVVAVGAGQPGPNLCDGLLPLCVVAELVVVAMRGRRLCIHMSACDLVVFHLSREDEICMLDSQQSTG